MLPFEEYSRLIADAIANLQFSQSPASLFEPIRYTLDSGGKRLRPALLLSTYHALGGDPADVMNQALGLEMFHNFTLLHDDVMDNADVRRGQLTVHRRWNASQAILSGDAMLTIATKLIADCKPDALPRILSLFNDTAMDIYRGQQLDIDYEHRRDVTIDEYISMIRLKTSVLLGCACAMGATLADAHSSVCQAFYDYGVNLGLAFQLRDDYLDTYGDPLLFGKGIGGDIVNEKKTWLFITALQERGEQLSAILSQKLDPSDRVAAVIDIYDSINLGERCNGLIAQYLDKALVAIGRAGIAPEALQFFTDLAQRSASRTH